MVMLNCIPSDSHLQNIMILQNETVNPIDATTGNKIPPSLLYGWKLEFLHLLHPSSLICIASLRMYNGQAVKYYELIWKIRSEPLMTALKRMRKPKLMVSSWNTEASRNHFCICFRRPDTEAQCVDLYSHSLQQNSNASMNLRHLKQGSKS